MKALRSNRRVRRGISIELILALVIALVVLGSYVQRKPVRLAMKAPATEEAPAAIGTEGVDVGVILAPPVRASSWQQLNCDQAWLNTLEQEVGSFEVIPTESISGIALQAKSWVIVPRNAASRLTPTDIDTLRAWVNEGGVLILEQPEGPWQELLGTRLSLSRSRDSRRITSFDGTFARGTARERVIAMPLRTGIVPWQPQNMSRGRDYQVLMEIDGNPGVVALERGRGRVLVLLFDFGRAAVAMQQGLPNNDLSLPEPESVETPDGLTVSSVAALNTDPRSSEVPVIDLLERNLLYLADLERPVGRLWNFPASYRGAMIATHSEAAAGDVASFMPEWEYSNEARSTTFAVPNTLSSDAAIDILRRHGDVQLNWVPRQAPLVPSRSWGVGGFRPIIRPMLLSEQLDMLREATRPYPEPRITRTIDGVWGSHYFSPWRELQAADIALDSSFGPAPAFIASESEDAGYIFGTGLPYRPLDSSGNRFALWEQPFVLSDGNPGYQLDRLRRLIVQSSDVYHSALVVDWRPDTMSRHPSFDAIEGWRTAFELAESQGLWVTTMSDYLRFLEYRQEAAIRSSFIERRLLIEVSIPEVERDEDGAYENIVPSVAFPARYRSRPVEHVWVDGVPQDVYELFMTGDRALHVVEVPPGAHRVEVFYGSLGDPDVEE